MVMKMKQLSLITVSVLTLTIAAASTGKAATDEELIKNAEMAAPSTVSSNATIYAFGEDGKMKTLREGTSGWWCMPDDPSTPPNDPMCGDANSLEFIKAYISKTDPPAGKVGVAYMLQGGPAASNTDPFLMEPAEGANWVDTGPHLMIFNSKGLFAGYKGGENPDTKVPYVMWEGTPYEHLMVPVQ
jgi:hypothetical protein